MTELDTAEVVQQMYAAEEGLASRWRGDCEDPAVDVLRELISKERAEGGEDVAMKYSVTHPELQVLFVVLCRRYGLEAFRRPGQRKTTFLVEGPQRFMNEVWTPLFGACAAVVQAHLTAWIRSVIKEFDTTGAPAAQDG